MSQRVLQNNSKDDFFSKIKMGTKKMAEEEGFEPSESCPSAVFKTAALNHSTILPLYKKAIFFTVF